MRTLKRDYELDSTDLLKSFAVTAISFTTALILVLFLAFGFKPAFAAEEVRTITGWTLTGDSTVYRGQEILSREVINVTNLADETSCKNVMDLWSNISYKMGTLGTVNRVFMGGCVKVKQFAFEKISW